MFELTFGEMFFFTWWAFIGGAWSVLDAWEDATRSTFNRWLWVAAGGLACLLGGLRLGELVLVVLTGWGTG